MTALPVEFLDELFPLVVCVAPSRYDDTELRRMFDGYQRYFTRGERYGLIIHVRNSGCEQPPRARKAIIDWANREDVRAKSAELCVGSTTVVANPISRGMMTALLWFYRPPTEHYLASSAEEAVDWCVARLLGAKVSMPPPARVREGVLERLRAL